MTDMPTRHSLYWDDFSRRIDETVASLKAGSTPPVRRVAIFVTQSCNLSCDYCNLCQAPLTMTEETFKTILAKHGGEDGQQAIFHITGGEPSVVRWLYPFIRANANKHRFHLNTNAIAMPPAEAIKRLKVSLDSRNQHYWDGLVGRKGAFKRVVNNIKASIPLTTVSITCTLTKENYQDAPGIAEFVGNEFPGLYALFFSVYKGTNPRFAFTPDDVQKFWDAIPTLEGKLGEESVALLRETLDEKKRLIDKIRFPENDLDTPCYISMSERVYSPTGQESHCSHLYRDKVFSTDNKKCQQCLYGCNRRLVKFNEEVETGLNQTEDKVHA